MALIKSLTLESGAIGNYWRITRREINDYGEHLALALYIDKTKRQTFSHLPMEVQFDFRPDDHPLSEFDPERVDTNLVDDIRDLELHVRYLHIRDIAAVAKAKTIELTPNEKAALFFVDAVDDTL